MFLPNRFLTSVALVVAITIAGCNHGPALTPPPPLEVVISQPITKEAIEDWDVYTGKVEAKDPVDMRARVRGEILDVTFTEGEEIPAGKLLFVIDDAPFQASLSKAKGQLAKAEANLKLAEEKLAIYKPLAEKGTVAKEELVQAFGNKGIAIGDIGTAKGEIQDAETNIKYCKIISPIAGKVGQAMITKGNIVNSDAKQNLLTTIIPVDPLYVSFYVNERALLNYQEYMRKRYAKEKKDEKAKIPVEMALQTDSGFPFKGVVDFVDNKVDENTGTFKVRAKFDNPKGPDGSRPLIPGLFARVRVAIGDAYKPILIANRAILSDQSMKYVLVVDKEKKNEVKRVDILPSPRVQPNGLVPIDSGLKGDEWIIVEGVNRARPGAVVNPKEQPMPRLPVK
jgi:RND family efflux transporter MFP subunit